VITEQPNGKETTIEQLSRLTNSARRIQDTESQQKKKKGIILEQQAPRIINGTVWQQAPVADHGSPISDPSVSIPQETNASE
jgi:hypothetical protein